MPITACSLATIAVAADATRYASLHACFSMRTTTGFLKRKIFDLMKERLADTKIATQRVYCNNDALDRAVFLTSFQYPIKFVDLGDLVVERNIG